MKYKPEEATLMSYIYGELSTEEQAKVEEYLSGSEEARKELEELKSTLSIMGQLKDKEVDIPTFTFNQSSQVVVADHPTVSFWRKSMAIAASIALLIFIGYLTKFNVSVGDQGFQMAFGNQNEGFSQEEVQSMIAEAITENNSELNKKLANSEAGIKEYVADNNQSLQNQLVKRVSNQPQSQSDFESERQQYLDYLKQLIEDSEITQKRYTDQVLTDFAIFLDIQRQNDMEVFQTRFNNLEDNTELNSFKTDQILSNLGSTVENPNQY
ncbi:anti-sigma factor family protein [Ekhidna sp. To15]|uniref:anti-sigma factor family protein n=1 Tax=Ekhidna sp. To15 TaxID=3395267 RepID=UPI003F51BB69